MTSKKQLRLFSLLALVLLLSSTTIYAQEQVRFTFSGYVQAIAQYGSEGDYIKVGNVTPPYDHSTTRMGIRRGRLATQATYGDLGAKIEINAVTRSSLSSTSMPSTSPTGLRELSSRGD